MPETDKIINELTRENEMLKIELAKKEAEIAKLNKIIQQFQQPRHNERGAGRKPSLSVETRYAIKEEYSDGITIRELAQKYGCSVGSIHSIIHKSNV